MKIFITLFLTAVMGFVIYIKYDTKKFMENLPQSPSAQSVETATDEKRALQPQIKDEFDNIEQNVQKTNMDAMPGNHSHDRADSRNYDYNTFDTTSTSGTDPPPATAKGGSGVSDSIEDVPESGKKIRIAEAIEMYKNPYERIKLLKPWLVQTYGDTPEVNTFLELELKIATADTHTTEEAIRHAELAAKFYPTPGNQKSLENTRRMAAHAANGVFINPRNLPGNVRFIRKGEHHHD